VMKPARPITDKQKAVRRRRDLLEGSQTKKTRKRKALRSSPEASSRSRRNLHGGGGIRLGGRERLGPTSLEKRIKLSYASGDVRGKLGGRGRGGGRRNSGGSRPFSREASPDLHEIRKEMGIEIELKLALTTCKENTRQGSPTPKLKSFTLSRKKNAREGEDE